MSQSFVFVIFVICRLISTIGLTLQPAELLHLRAVDGGISFLPADIERVSTDFGGVTRSPPPLAVLRPSSAADIASLIRAADGIPISARGHGHSLSGQAAAEGGVVVEMNHAGVATWPKKKPEFSPENGEYYVDVWGGDLWIDVLKWTLKNGGLAPKSWTDYLYLTVGGTLSNAGISGQAFHHGPQISNVFELDVVTGKGDIQTCSEKMNAELFHSVLGGLGQFGIITRARIALEKAPQRVKWIRVLYANFTAFTVDQERLISLHVAPANERFDYVEGFVIVDEGLINNWRSSFFSPQNPVKISSMVGAAASGPLYCLELTRNYDDTTAAAVDQEVEALLKTLDFIPSSVFMTDLPYIDFLDRVHKAELKMRAKGLWEVPHPWLNLLVPASRIADFDDGVFRGILQGNKISGPILIYPINKHKWDNRSSVVTPEEEVFYLVAFLRSALPDSGDPAQSLDHLIRQNRKIIEFCRQARMDFKQYLAHYETSGEWEAHFGQNWERFLRRKAEFDPKFILGSGQGIFRPTPRLFPS